MVLFFATRYRSDKLSFPKFIIIVYDCSRNACYRGPPANDENGGKVNEITLKALLFCTFVRSRDSPKNFYPLKISE